MRRALAATAAALAVAIAAPSAALAVPANILGGDPDPMAANANLFKPTSYDHEAGTVANLTWVAGGAHDADATTNGPDGALLFSTELTRSTLPVPGTQYLALGAHPFICSIHAGMTATLNVNSGAPRPRPALSLKLKTKSLDQALKQKAVKVKVTIAGGSGETADVNLKLGKKTIGLPAEANATRTVKVRLTKAGRSALEKRNKANLKAAAEVQFGSPASAKGTLK